MEWYVKVLKQYFDFAGRARRKEYWMFFLFNVIFGLGLNLIDMTIGTFNETTGTGLLYAIYSFAVLIPGIAVAVRRLHDIDKSGWWLFIALIPIIGAIILIVFMCSDSKEDNEYGTNPKIESLEV